MLSPGTTLGPYQILAPLGAGGMGEVYRASDTRLGREVALKAISAAFTRDRSRILRFEQEARAAGALNHPNVCVIHDIGTHDGSPFVVMELLEGESLRARLNQGPIPASKAIDWAAQAAHGLAAAHDKGIIHRDLKPENLFLTKDGRIKVLDFGLAKLTRPEILTPGGQETVTIAATETGAVMGTAGYMAPEQVRGEPADHRADLFVLGSILYELLTGKRAFTGTTSYETSYHIVNDDPPPMAASGRPIPAGADAIVRRCLEKNPEERFQSARDLGFALESARDSAAVPAMAPPAARGSDRATGTGKRRLTLAVAAVALAAALGIVAARNSHRFVGDGPPPATAVAPGRIVVADFENRTGEPALAIVGRMTADWITDELARVGLEVVPRSYAAVVVEASTSVDSARSPRQDPALALAQATGAGILVSGEYYLNGATLQIRAKVMDTAARSLIAAIEPAEASRDSVSRAVGIAARRVTDILGIRLAGTETMRNWATKYEAAPPDYQAYIELHLAEDAGTAGDDGKMLEHIQRAIAIDPDFVQAHVFLGYWYRRHGRYQEALAALEPAEQRRAHLTPLGRLDLDATTAWVLHRHEEAVVAYRELVRLAPADVVAQLTLAHYLLMANRPREAVTVLSQPVRWEVIMPPSQPYRAFGYFGALTQALDILGDHERELTEARRGCALFPDIAIIRATEAAALAALGRFDELDAVIRDCLNRPLRLGTAGHVLLSATVELRSHGHRQESLAMARRAVAWLRDLPHDDPRRSPELFAKCLTYAGEWDEAAQIYARLADDYAGGAAEIPFRARCGVMAAVQGDRESARRISRELEALHRPYLFGQDTYQRALVAAQLGDRDQAVDLLRRAVSEGLVFGETTTFAGVFAEDIALEPLRGYAPFEELMQPKG